MKSTPNLKPKHHNHNFLIKKEAFYSLTNYTPPLFFYITCLSITILLCLSLLNYTTNINYTTNTQSNNRTISVFADSRNETCDLFKGRWVRDSRGELYTNYSCKTIPFLKNCFLHGRKDTGFLHWRWKPDECELPRFGSGEFLAALQGKTMAFIGDSLARNQMESLLCLLSKVESPNQLQKDPEDRFTTWEFPKHNFTLMVLWSQFLVSSTERVVNGSTTGGFDLHLDRVDPNWSEKLPSIDYAIFSDAHWFFRQNYLYEGSKLIGCVYCQAPDVSSLEPGLAIRKAFRAAFRAINDCRNCKKIFSFLRTYSPSHFEHGTWNNGGGCNGTRPIERDEVVDESGPDWEYRKIQVEEIEIARSAGEESGNNFGVLDVTEIMSMRRDGHPGIHWGNKWMKGYSDCIHWCLPGPVDVWNELLFELIKRQIRVPTRSEMQQ